MSVIISTDLQIINDQIINLLNDIRFELLFTMNMAIFDESFAVNAINLPAPICIDSPYSNDEQIALAITIFVGFILTLVFVLALIGIIQMYKYDVTIYVTGILLFGLYTWDFYSDILFSWVVYNYYAVCNDDLMLALFIGCLIFLILPIVASIWSLFRFQDKWTEDPAIGDRVTGWNRDWSTYLLILTLLSGSSFAAVNILNSRVFGHPIFCMGLSYRHLKKFENQRLWGVILSENGMCTQLAPNSKMCESSTQCLSWSSKRSSSGDPIRGSPGCWYLRQCRRYYQLLSLPLTFTTTNVSLVSFLRVATIKPFSKYQSYHQK